MNKMQEVLRHVSGKLDLPPDILAGMPRIELLGTDKCSIEPHEGLLEYGKDRIAVKTAVGPVGLSGTNLEIKRMNNRCIVIVGDIRGLNVAR